MTTNLADLVEVRNEFARSANIERDSGRLDPGYLPTARARDVIRRISTALGSESVDRSLSITGTYGSGKSSLAVFLSALFGPPGSLREKAHSSLAAVDPVLAKEVASSLALLPDGGMLIATVTARREPVAATVARALGKAVRVGGVKPPLRKSVEFLAADANVSAESILQAVHGITDAHGLLLIIDEFGKTIEEYFKSGESMADLYLLQELAEHSVKATGYPSVLILLQHLAFADYDTRGGTSGREWAKVQGRFSDIPYVESGAESQALMASVFRTTCNLESWVAQQKLGLNHAGLSDLLQIPIDKAFPLHPVVAGVLPDLCFRYGQNERTLFAFLAGPDPAAVPDVLGSLTCEELDQLPTVRLHHVYDYFLSSAPTMVSNSPHAARWIEIETRIRDAAALESGEIRLLKSIAVLNLIASGGATRASRQVILFAVADGQSGTESPAAVERALERLIERGYVTYRQFADEFRIWSGTDFDVQSMVEYARRAIEGESPAKLLNAIRPQVPVVAGRHSQRTGILRVFDRLFIDQLSPPLLTDLGQDFDGLVLVCLGECKDLLNRGDLLAISATRPVVMGIAANSQELVKAAIDLAAHHEALRLSGSNGADWVAQRELRERVAAAAAALDEVVDKVNAGSQVIWRRILDGKATPLSTKAAKPLPSVLSGLCDLLYPDSPIVRNEMLSRRSLTSQGAKARRNLLEAMLDAPEAERCGIEGYPPERAMYEAVFGSTGIHRRRGGVLDFGAPTAEDPYNYMPAWTLIEGSLKGAGNERVGLRDIYRRLMSPPVGLKEGPIPLLLAAALIRHADDVAIYEDGTFVPRLDITILERLIRNPDMFAVQGYALRGPRRLLAEGVVDKLRASRVTPRHTRLPSVVTAVGPLLTRMRSLPEYSLRTKSISTKAVALRDRLLEAREPDRLLFTDIPEALGHSRVGTRDSGDPDIRLVIRDLFRYLGEIEEAHGLLLQRIGTVVEDSLAVDVAASRVGIRARFETLRDSPIDSETKTVATALLDEHLDDEEWLSYLGMISAGKPTQSWSDSDAEAALARLAQDLRRLRNLESLPTDARPGHRAVRVALTEQDGFEDHRVVWLPESQAARLHEIAASALAQARQDIGGNAEEALVAAITLAMIRPERAVTVFRHDVPTRTRRK